MRRDGRPAHFRTWQRHVWEERKAAAKIKSFWKKVSTLKSPNPDQLDRKLGDTLVQDKLDSSGSSTQLPKEPEQEVEEQEELDNSVKVEESKSDFC